MGRKLYQVVAMLSIAVTLAVLGLAGAMLGTGKLSAHNVEAIAKVLRGESLTPPAPTTQPVVTTQPTAGTQEQLTINEAAIELTNLLMERRKQELAAQMMQLENLRKSIASEREDVRQAKVKLQEEALASQQRQADAGFKKQLKLYESMQPKQVKDIFMGLSEVEAGDYLQAMSPRMASTVISQFKSPEEKTRLQRLLERMKVASK